MVAGTQGISAEPSTHRTRFDRTCVRGPHSANSVVSDWPEVQAHTAAGRDEWPVCSDVAAWQRGLKLLVDLRRRGPYSVLPAAGEVANRFIASALIQSPTGGATFAGTIAQRNLTPAISVVDLQSSHARAARLLKPGVHARCSAPEWSEITARGGNSQAKRKLHGLDRPT